MEGLVGSKGEKLNSLWAQDEGLHFFSLEKRLRPHVYHPLCCLIALVFWGTCLF